MVQLLFGAVVDSEKFLERVAEFWTEDGVQDGIQRRVEVAQPEEEGQHGVIEVTRLADGEQDGNDKERQPAD